jgi:acetylornithine/N-succinyldiaminopimelate aminotransferase
MGQSHLLQNYGERNFVITRGLGSWVWDDKGEKYLDCVSGVAVNAFGHAYPPILAAIKGQVDRFLHASNLYLLETQMDLADALCEAMKMDRAFFCNSGTEANEAAIKFARRFCLGQGQGLSQDAKFEIISFTSSFHGRTYGSMAATGQDKIRKGFGPLPEGFRVVPANDVAALNAAIGPQTAAIIFEPIMAEGGIISMSQEMADALKVVQAQGVLLIADEIQTGLCRTGDMLCSWSLGLKPDLVSLAKPLGGGLPLGAVLMSEAISSSIHAGDHGSTFGGNPVACAAGLAVLKALMREGFIAGLRERATVLKEGLEGLIARKAAVGISVGPLVGKGFLTGFHYGGDLGALALACRSQGLLVHRAGQDVVRLLPPLNISLEEIGEVIDRLDRVMI